MELDTVIAQLAETVSAPITAQQLAFVILINALESKGLISREAIAAQLEASARVMPPETINPEPIARQLYGLADAIRTSTTTSSGSSLQ